MRVENDIATRLALCTLTQAVCRAGASRAGVPTAPRGGRIPTDRSNSGGCLGGGTGAGRSGWGSASTLRLVVDVEVGVGAAGCRTFALIEGFAWVQPAGAGAEVRVALGEDDKVAGRMGVAVTPAVLSAAAGNGETWAGFFVVA